MTSSPSCEAEDTDGGGGGGGWVVGTLAEREGAWLHKTQVRPPLAMCVCQPVRMQAQLHETEFVFLKMCA